ncbi:hypothetical protein ACWEGE_20045 [Amycolatopsis sp. NPDC004747]
MAGDWLPPPERGEPEWAARGTAVLHTRFARWVFTTVAGVLIAAAFGFAGRPVPAAGAAVFTGVSGCWAFAVHRQAIAARRTGWRTATVTLAGVTSAERTSGAIAVRFPDGSRIDLRPLETNAAVRALSDVPDLPALIAGNGPAALTVFVPPKPPWREKAVLFRARAATYRWLPGS